MAIRRSRMPCSAACSPRHVDVVKRLQVVGDELDRGHSTSFAPAAASSGRMSRRSGFSHSAGRMARALPAEPPAPRGEPETVDHRTDGLVELVEVARVPIDDAARQAVSVKISVAAPAGSRGPRPAPR